MAQPQPQAVSSGSLKMSIKLGPRKKTCPFYLMKESLPPKNPLLGSNDLISYANLSSEYHKYCYGKLKPDLASSMQGLCNTNHLTSSISGSTSLRSLIEKPPITGKLIGLPNDLKGFNLTPGSVPEAYRLFDTSDLQRLLGRSNITTEEDNKAYDEFGNNFRDSEEKKKAHRSALKRSLNNDDEDPEAAERRRKHKKEKKKSKKDKKKDKEKKKADTDGGMKFT